MKQGLKKMNARKINQDISDQNWADFFADMASALLNRRLSRAQIKKIYLIMRESETGRFWADHTGEFTLNSDRSEWDYEYLEYLYGRVLNGYASEEITLHMWEVANKIKWKDAGYIVKVCIASASAIAGTVVALNIIF